MSLKFIGGAGLVLAVLLFLLAAAQPATVADSTTTCIDSTYYQDCSTVNYERPNPQRSQLFGAAGFLFFGGLLAYGVGAARSSNDAEPGSDGDATASPAQAGSTSSGTETLREQLDARQSDGADAATQPTPEPVADESRPPLGYRNVDATTDAADEPPQDGSVDVENAPEWRVPSTVSVTASALASAFVLSWLLGSVTAVGSVIARAFVFALCAVPGVLLYRRYVEMRPDAGDSVEVTE